MLAANECNAVVVEPKSFNELHTQEITLLGCKDMKKILN